MQVARRVIVEVRWGPLAYRKTTVEPGQILCVGRDNLLELAVPQDEQMSAKHFSLSWDGELCRVRDLDSAGGTWVQGERATDACVKNGAWIKAGRTNFMVYVEAATPPHRRTLAPAEPALSALRELERRSGPLFAVVDASRGARPLQLLREAVDQHVSLYEGVKGEALAECAPYLVAFRRDSGLLERLVQEGWGARWGIFLACGRALKDVRRHFRRFLLIEHDESSEKFYFRFYDPRTLRAFVPSCTPRQRADFFGEVVSFFAEGERGEVLTFTHEGT